MGKFEESLRKIDQIFGLWPRHLEYQWKQYGITIREKLNTNLLTKAYYMNLWFVKYNYLTGRELCDLMRFIRFAEEIVPEQKLSCRPDAPCTKACASGHSIQRYYIESTSTAFSRIESILLFLSSSVIVT